MLGIHIENTLKRQRNSWLEWSKGNCHWVHSWQRLDRKWKNKRKKKRITEISEGKSKRVTLKQKHKVIRKVKEHHKRKEKDAKKLGHCRKPRVEKDASIPSDWPLKEHELKGLEARRARALEEIEQKKVARKERAKRRKRWIQGSENYGSYTRSKCCKEIKIGVWRNMTRNWPCRVMKDAAEKGNKNVDLLLLLVEDVNREEESDDEDPLKRDDELKEIVDEYFGKESKLGEGEKFLSYYFLKPMCKEEDGKTKNQVIDEAEIELFEKNEDLVFGMDGNCKSTKGISMAVVDANAVMNEQSVTDLAENFVTVPEVLSEIRDAQHRLKFISFTIETMEPSPESLSRFIKFAKAIGDLHTLSDVDLKLIALTHTFEAEVHGIKNLRDVPPPIQIVRVKRLPEKELPGLGFHVANLEEREALGNETEEKSNTTAKILLLQDTNMNIIPSENCYEASYVASHTVDEEEEGGRRQKRYPPKKTEVKLEGNMVVEGLYTSQGENDEEDGGKWRHAVSSSTHKYLFRRRTKWEHYNALAEKEIQKDQKADKAGYFTQDTNDQMSNDSKGKCSEKNDEELSSILKDMRLEEDSLKALQEGTEETNFSNGENDIEVEAEGIDVANVANTVRGFSFRFGVATKIIEACADNEQSQLFVGNMGFSGVSISMLRKKKISTGQCVCLIDDYGNRTMRPCLSSGVKILADELIKEDFTGFKC
ncbi:hypothetical protein Bca52824_056156 [Brassica carinata]|uniref:Uncharacterized protein n=1 Tax=Brassica carinata TaxID=52824 RepID=A0A8X7UDJ9_BRACI|nr:hypothetical protein Bca52824_056156 [Brassica carinata]